MKLQWMKDILGDAYTEELDASVCAAIGERFVSRQDFNDKNTKLKEVENQAAQLEETVKTRDAQLEELKKSAGAGEELQRQIDALTQQNKAQKAAHDKELAELRLTAAVDAALTAAGARNNTAVRAVLADFLENAAVVDGKVVSGNGADAVTLEARVEAMKKDAATDFLFGTAPKYTGWKPGEGGDGGRSGVGKKPSEMSYSELAAYLAENPDAQLEA